MTEHVVEIKTADFQRVMRAILKSAAKDNARPVLAGVYIEVEGGRLRATAADGFRLSTADAPCESTTGEKLSGLIAAEWIALVCKAFPARRRKVRVQRRARKKTSADVPDDLLTIGVTGERWAFTRDGVGLEVPTIDGIFPDYPAIMHRDAPFVEKFSLNPTFLADLFAGAKGQTIRFGIKSKSGAIEKNLPIFVDVYDDQELIAQHIIMPMIVDIH